MALMKSFASKGYAKETFNWQYFYYYLTNDGINYLRQYLALPDDIVPATLKKTASTGIRPGSPDERKSKSAGPGGDFNPEFKREGGYGRGKSEYRREG